MIGKNAERKRSGSAYSARAVSLLIALVLSGVAITRASAEDGSTSLPPQTVTEWLPGMASIQSVPIDPAKYAELLADLRMVKSGRTIFRVPDGTVILSPGGEYTMPGADGQAQAGNEGGGGGDGGDDGGDDGGNSPIPIGGTPGGPIPNYEVEKLPYYIDPNRIPTDFLVDPSAWGGIKVPPMEGVERFQVQTLDALSLEALQDSTLVVVDTTISDDQRIVQGDISFYRFDADSGALAFPNVKTQGTIEFKAAER